MFLATGPLKDKWSRGGIQEMRETLEAWFSKGLLHDSSEVYYCHEQQDTDRNDLFSYFIGGWPAGYQVADLIDAMDKLIDSNHGKSNWGIGNKPGRLAPVLGNFFYEDTLLVALPRWVKWIIS
jgi:hypothetical protein